MSLSKASEEDFSPLFSIETFEAEKIESDQPPPPPPVKKSKGPDPLEEDPSVMTWSLPPMEKKKITIESEDFEMKVARIEREAYEKGFAQGQKDGLALEKTRLEEMGRQVEAIFEELRDLKIQIYNESEGEILKLAMVIAKKVIGEEVRTNEKIILNSIKSALKFLTDKRKVRIIINPEDMEETKRMLPDLSRLTRGGNFQLTESNAVERGGCILETGFGKINATIDDQLKGIEEVIFREYQAHGKDSQ